MPPVLALRLAIAQPQRIPPLTQMALLTHMQGTK